MTKHFSTKRALLASVLSFLLCVSMLVGSTFAWFTDTATSSVNTIQAGKLDITFMMKDGDTWVSAEGKSLNFTNVDGSSDILWEPGATFTLPAVKLVNNGDLALKFKLLVNGVAGSDMELAEVLEVIVNGTALTQADGTPVTLKDIMADPDGVAYGTLLPEAETTEYTIALHMAEEAGNEYQGMTIRGLSLVAYATQYTCENDSKDNQYDAGAEYDEAIPVAYVGTLTGEELNITLPNDVSAKLDAGYAFIAMDDASEAEASPYRYYHADFVVSADADIPANGLTLAGYYSAWCDSNNGGNWLGLSSSEAVTAGTQIRLIQDGLSAALGGNVYVNYEELCKTVQEFDCGLIAADPSALAGTTITVELRLYEVEEPSAENAYSRNVETGEYIVIGTYSYTY